MPSPKKHRVMVDLDSGLLRRIEHIAVDWDSWRKDAIVRLLELGVEQVEKEQAGDHNN